MGAALDLYDIVLDETYHTEHFCAACQEPIPYIEEVFLLQVVQSCQSNGRLFYYPVLSEDGDYAFDPTFICFDCWEELEEHLTELYTDVPPSKEGSIRCTFCDSGIEPFEQMAIITKGEFRASKRVSESTVFEPLSQIITDVCHDCLIELQQYLGDEYEPE